MKKTLLSLGVAAVLGLTGMSASAMPINVGGVVWDPDFFLDFTMGDTMYESVVNAPDDVLTGYGKITALNGANDLSFCPSGCEITYKFTYTLDSITGGNRYTFRDGELSFYVSQNAAEKNFDAIHSADADGARISNIGVHKRMAFAVNQNGLSAVGRLLRYRFL